MNSSRRNSGKGDTTREKPRATIYIYMYISHRFSDATLRLQHQLIKSLYYIRVRVSVCALGAIRPFNF